MAEAKFSFAIGWLPAGIHDKINMRVVSVRNGSTRSATKIVPYKSFWRTAAKCDQIRLITTNTVSDVILMIEEGFDRNTCPDVWLVPSTNDMVEETLATISVPKPPRVRFTLKMNDDLRNLGVWYRTSVKALQACVPADESIPYGNLLGDAFDNDVPESKQRLARLLIGMRPSRFNVLCHCFASYVDDSDDDHNHSSSVRMLSYMIDVICKEYDMPLDEIMRVADVAVSSDESSDETFSMIADATRLSYESTILDKHFTANELLDMRPGVRAIHYMICIVNRILMSMLKQCGADNFLIRRNGHDTEKGS